MAKILNLDKLDTKNKPRELVIGGKSHPIVEMTVANFIETTRAATKLEGAEIGEQIEATMDLICRSIPTLDRAELAGRSMETLATISAFVQGENPEAVEDTDAAQEGDEAGK